MTYSIGSNSPGNLLSAPAQGVRRGVAEADTAAQKIANGDLDPDNFTALVQAEVAIKANRVVAINADDLVGSLLNRKA